MCTCTMCISYREFGIKIAEIFTAAAAKKGTMRIKCIKIPMGAFLSRERKKEEVFFGGGTKNTKNKNTKVGLCADKDWRKKG